MDSIRISVSGDAKELQPTIDKLKEVGKVSEQNAAQFKVADEQYQTASKVREQLLLKEIQNLEALKRARLNATTSENITGFNKSIKESEQLIKNLTPQTEKAVSSMANFGASVKKSYGFLRLMANIIPGIGISGLILAGWEALYTLINGIGDDMFKLRTEEQEFNTQHIKNVTEILTKERELNYEIEKRNILLGIDAKTNSDADLQRLQLRIENEKELGKIQLEYNKQNAKLESQRPLNTLDDIQATIEAQGSDITQIQQKFYNKQTSIKADRDKLLLAQQKLYETKLGEIIDAGNRNRAKLVHDISVQDLENKKKDLETNAKILAIQARENAGIEIEDKIAIDKRLTEIEDEKNIQILNIEKDIAKKKYRHDVEVANKTITDQDQLNNRIYNLKLAYKDKLSGLDNAYKDSLLISDADLYDKLLKDYDEYTKEQAKIVEEDLKKRLAAVKENEERLADVLKLENETNYTEGKITQEQHDKQDIEDQLAVLELKKVNLEEYSNEYIEIEIKEQELLRQLREKEKKANKKKIDETIADLKVMYDFFIKINEDRIKNNIETIDHEEGLQKSAIDKQRQLAIAGKDNDLAFEEKRQADLEKKRQQEKKKLMKLKELETFLNSVASFSKDDPKSAVAKALAELAIVKGVEASFAEEGGLVGQIKEKSWLGRKHKGGGDILVHAQTGEGILSRNDISNMGGEQAFLNFKNMLNTGLPPIPMSGVMFQGMDTKKLEDKLDNLEKAFKNKKETYVDWESHGVMNVTTVENGIKDTVKHILRKPRI